MKRFQIQIIKTARVIFGILSTVLFLAVSIISCSFNAERDNILDPKRSGLQGPSSLSGTIFRKNGVTPIEGAVVTLNPGNAGCISDANGFYRINIFEENEYEASITHPDYKLSDTTFFVEYGANIAHDFTLDAKIHFDSLSITSQRIVNLSSSVEKAYVYAKITDPDGSGDMANSTVSVLYLEQEFSMTNVSLDVWEKFLNNTDFPSQSINNSMGVEYIVRVIDQFGDTTYSDVFLMRRILDFTVSIKEPDYGSTGAATTSKPKFVWRDPYIANPFYFDYKYIISVFPEDDPFELRYQKEIPKDSLQTQLIVTELNYYYEMQDDSLDDDNYYWTAQIADDEGDFSRSARVLFIVND